MAKEKKRASVQVGGSTILMIFTVLCLTVFAVLSLSSAKADVSLTQKAEQTLIAYYKADGEAEEKLRQWDEQMAEAQKDANEEQEFFLELEKRLGTDYDRTENKIKFEIPLTNGSQSLFIEIEPLYQAAEKNYKINKWKVQNTGEYLIDETLNVWLGE